MTHTCRTPWTTFLRRLNSVWACPICDRLWVLRRYGVGFWAEYRLWTPFGTDHG